MAKSNNLDTLTVAEYITLQTAFDHFNTALWSGKLPQVLITLQRKKGARGYFSPDRFSGRGFEGKASEIALNPDTFSDRTDGEILSTLVHEMAHLWQEVLGTPCRKAYHNKQWADEMKRVGLYPSDTAQPGGKETGQKVSHYIVDGGSFASAWAKLESTGIKLKWESKGKPVIVKAKAESKVKYTCPNCGQNSWARPDASLLCGTCSSEEGGLVGMIAD